jgi:hypothetical protein
MSEVLDIDDLERAEALLDRVDETQIRLEADIARSESIVAAIALASGTERTTGAASSTIDMLRYAQELEASEDADLKAVAALLRSEIIDGVDGSKMQKDDVVDRLGRLAVKDEIARLGLLDANTFNANLGKEVTRHMRVQDSLAFFVVEYDEALEVEVEDELRLVRALRELAINPGEVVGHVGEKGYGVLIPWLEPAQAQGLMGTFDALVRGALPNEVASIGMNAGVPAAGAGATRFEFPKMTPQSAALGRGRGR